MADTREEDCTSYFTLSYVSGILLHLCEIKQVPTVYEPPNKLTILAEKAIVPQDNSRSTIGIDDWAFELTKQVVYTPLNNVVIHSESNRDSIVYDCKMNTIKLINMESLI